MLKNYARFLLIVLIVLMGEQLYAQNCTINAGTPQTICENATLTLVGTRGGSSTAPTLWTQVEGPSATITSPSTLTTTVTNLVGGNTYKFRLATTCSDGSLISDEVAITVRAITKANAGADVTACPGTNVITLVGTSLAAGETPAWTVQGTNNGVTIINGAAPSTGISLNGANSGATTVRYTITSAQGCSSFDDVVVTNRGGVSAVSAGADVNLDGCYSGSRSIANLSGSFGGGGAALNQQGTWLVVSGPNLPTFSNKNQNNSGLSNLIAGTYILRWTVAGACVNGSDETQITVAAAKGAVTPASIAATGAPFCDGRTSTLLVGSNPIYANEVVAWNRTAGSATLSPPPYLTTNTISGLTNSNTSVTYQIRNTITGCSSTSSTVTLSTSTAPSITITTPSPYRVSCGTSSAVVAFTATGSTSAREYSVISGPAPGTYPSTWKTITSGTTNVLSGFTSPGTYLVRLRAVPSGNACATAFADITIIVSGNASLSNAGTDQTLACNVFNTQLAGNSITNGVGSWTQIAGPNSATIDNPSAYNANITNLVAGKYTFKWYVSNGTTCPSSEDLVDVIVSAPSPTTSVVGANTSSCAGSVVYLEGNTPVRNEVGTWTVSPSAGVVISDIHNPVAAVTNLLNNTNYTFTWTISNACGTSASSYAIATSSTAGASIASAGSDQCLAAGTTSATLAGNNPTSGTGTWSQISGPNTATITNSSLYNSGVTGLLSGTYKFEWKIAKAGCTATKDTVVISVGNPTAANAGADNFSLCGTSVTLAGNNPALGSGMWTQVSGVTQASFADPMVYNTTASGLSSGRYTFRWTVSNGACTSSSDDVVIIASTPPSAAAAGSDFSVCNASNATLDASVPTTGSGVWSIVSGPNTPTFGNVASPTSSITGLASGVYTLRWKVSAGETCPSTSDDVVVTVLPAAVVTNPTESFCSIDNANLVGNMVIGASGVTYTWTNVSGPNTPTITNQNAAGNIAKATGLIPGTYTFQYAINAGTCSVSATKTVTIDQMPSLADAGTLDKSFCAANSVVMNANTPSSGTGTWSALTFPTGATINYTPNNSAPNATISLNKTGTYVFTWKVVSGTCTNQQNVTVQNDPAPSIANAGLDQTNVCGTSTLLAANAPTAGVGTWSVISGPSTPTFDSQMLNNALVSNMIPGDYTLRWTISSGAICTAKTDDVKLTIKDLPTTANAGADQSLCNIYTTQLQASTLSGGTTGMWTKQSGPASISFDDPTNPTATISSLTQGTYVLRWTTTLGTCTSFDEVTINVYNPPSTAVVPADFSYCLYGANPSLSATLPVDGNGAWSKVSGGNVLILTPNSNTTSLAGISTAGDYIFKWTVSNGSCPVSEAQVKMTVKQPVTPANAGVSQSLYKKTAAVLAANTPTSGVGMWSIVSKPSGAPDPSFSDLSNPNATITGLQPGDYVLRWTIDNGGCSSSDDVEIYNTLVPSVSVNDATATEGSNLTFTITLSNASGVATSVGYTTAVNAGAGYADNSDFTASAGTVTFLPGEVSKTITIATNDDNIYEGTETFDLNLSSPTELTISDSKGVGTITDNEAKPTITVTTGISATEGQELAFKILLSHPCSSAITVTRKTQDGTAATADGDYTAIASSVVTIPAGTTSLDVPVYTTVDAKFEPNETVSLVLSAPSGNATLGAPSTGVGTILNDDAKPKVSIDNQTIVEGGSLTFNVTLTNPSSQAISAAYSATSGTAIMGTDFANVPSGTISFAPGETSKTITVSSLQDVIDEDDEQFSITLSSLTNVDAGTLVGVGTITDNDAAPSLSISDASTAEGGKLSFTITLSAASEKTVTVTAASADGSATAADNDYTALASTIVTFAPGETSKVVEVQTSDDGKYEGNEDILLNLSLAANATIADAQGVGTITDEADKPEIAIDPATTAEGGNLSFRIWLSKPATAPVTVNYKTSDFAAAIGKASGGTDYTAAPLTTITFAAGTTEQTVAVASSNDDVYEGDETFKVELSGASTNSTINSAAGVALGTITDEADKPTITVSDASVAEGGNLEFVVSLSNAAVAPVTVECKSEDYLPAADGKAAGGTDYQVAGLVTLTFPANSTASQTVTVPTTNDTRFEGDEIMKLILANSSSNSTIAKATAVGTITDAADYPSLSITGASVAEGGSLGFMVTLSNESYLPITAKYSTSDGTAKDSDSDYTPVNLGTITFAAGTTALTTTVNVATINNNIYEGDETLNVTLSDATNATISATGGAAEGTITDEANKPSLSIADALSVNEGGDLSFRVSLSNLTATPVTVFAKTTDGSATSADNDYTSLGLTKITIPALAGFVDVAIHTTADATFEADEDLFVQLSNPSSNASIAADKAKGIILNDDTKPTISIANVSASEGDPLVFEVRLSNPSDKVITVDYTESDVTATSGTDFTALPSGSLTFNPGEVVKLISVQTTLDALDEADETFSIALSNLVNVDAGSVTAVGTIIDVNALPTLSVGDATVAEGGKLQFVVSLSAASGKAVTVKASSADGSATTADNDYTSVSNLAVTFAPGEVSKVVEVSTTADTKFESDETISLNLTDATNATIADGNATGTITNDDTKPTVAVGSPTVTEGGVLAFVVSLSNPSNQAISVGYTAEDGTATMGTDFDNVPAGTLSFAAGETSKTVLVPTTDDALNEDSEQLSLKLSSLVNVDPDKLVGVGTILDNDGAPTLSVGDATVAEGGKLQFVVSLSAASGKAVSVKASTADGSATTADNDYTSVSNLAVTFAPGETSKVVEVPTTADTKFESDETISLELTDATNATIADGSATGTITNDDTKPTVAVGSPTVTESGVLAFVVSLSNPSDQAISVGYTLEDGTATMGTDFDNVPAGTLTFAAGETSKTVLVPTTDDALNEDSEQLSLKLNSLVNVDPDKLVGVGTILDNDGAPTLSVGDATVAEGGKLQFVVTLSAASGKAVSVKASTADGSATTADNDYTSVSNLVVTFAPGEVSKVVEVPTTADTKFESDETISLNLTDANNATIADGNATGTITNDDTKPSVAVGSPTVTEGGVLAFVVSLSNPSDQAISVGYTAEDGTATMGADFDNVPAGTLTFAAGETSKTVLVSTTDDALNEDSEQLSLKLNSLVNVDPDKLVGVGTILDNDGAPTLSVGDATVAEGGKLQFVVSLSAASGKAVSVKASTADGSATITDNDYTAASNLTVTFAPGEVSKVVEVPTTADTKFESDETISLELTDATNATIADGSATGTITNDDTKPTVAVGSPTVTEGGVLAFVVSLSNPSDQAISAGYTVEDGTATMGTDFDNVPAGTLSFAAGETSKTVLVPTTDDALNEDSEQLSLKLNSLVNVDPDKLVGVGTILDNDGAPTLSVGDATVAEGGKLQFVVSLSAASGKAVTVKASTADGSATITDNDYTAVSNLAVTFAPGEVSKVVEVPTTADTKFESDETISLELTDATNATIADGNATGTITNDDTKPTVAVGSPTVTEGGVLAFVVSLSNPSDQAISAGYTVEDGTATMGTDFDNVPAGTLTFAAGETSKTVLVPTTDDALNEDSEQLSLKLNSLVNVDPDKLVGVGTILDNDGAPTLSVGDATVAEGGKLQFVVSLSAASGKAVTVKASTADGSATIADNDYTSVSNLAVTFAPGETSKVVEVPTTADTKFESDETIALELTDATNATIADGSATGTITNDDVTPAISVADATAIEGDKLRFRITLDKVSVNEVSVNIGLQDITTSSSDYSALPSTTVTFAAGDLEKWVEVSTLKDAIVEGNEQVKLVLSGATNATIAVPEAIGTITDVMVKPLNFDFEVSGTEDNPVAISKNGFADNFDKDYKTELLKVKIESLPENGSLVLNGSPVKVGDEISSADLDMLTFIPSPNWNGETSFKWKGQNSAGYADVPAVVTIKIAGVNDLPEATNDSFMIDEKALLSGNVAANDKLSGDGGNTFTLVGLPAHGEVVLNSDGSFTYTQKGGYAANDSFTYKLCDANGDCSTASVNIVITQIINNIKPPVAANDNATTKGDTPVTISVLANDSDPDSQLLPETLTILDQPQHGTVVVNGDGTVTYTANKGYVGEDTFTYRICDNGNPQMCATATVNVTVSGLDVKIPDGFSPNGDGVNDRFVIKGLETYPNNVLRIFNRWGNIVYQMKGYDNSWDGKNGGKGLHIGVDLPDGTYYYILDLGDGSKPQTSFVVIKR